MNKIFKGSLLGLVLALIGFIWALTGSCGNVATDHSIKADTLTDEWVSPVAEFKYKGHKYFRFDRNQYATHIHDPECMIKDIDSLVSHK